MRQFREPTNMSAGTAQILLPLLFFSCLPDCCADLPQDRGMKAQTQDLDLPAAVALSQQIGPGLMMRHSQIAECRIEAMMDGVHMSPVVDFHFVQLRHPSRYALKAMCTALPSSTVSTSLSYFSFLTASPHTLTNELPESRTVGGCPTPTEVRCRLFLL